MTWPLLVSLLIKSSLVAGAGLVCARFLAQRPADRVDILRGAVCLLLALPVIMNVLPAIDLALLPPSSLAVPSRLETTGSVPAAGTVSSTLRWPPSVQVIGGLWLLGVVAIVGQLLLGLRTLLRWTREGRPVTCGDWLAPLEDLSPADRPRLVSNDRVASPLSWGVAPGIVLVNSGALSERHAASAIMAHELAHLRRHDWVFLVLSRLALALFWFNPLVWRLHAVLAERSEEAADAAALETVDRIHYARALVRLATNPAPRLVIRRLAPRGAATAMAADARTLKTRIACIMIDMPARRRPLTVALTIAALAVVATPLAAVGLSRQDWVAPPAPPAPAPAVPPVAPPAPPEPIVPLSMASTVPPVAPAPPVPPPAPEGASYSYSRLTTPAERERAVDARARAVEAQADADEARRRADESRAQADEARRHADQSRVQADIARLAAEEARTRAAQARVHAEQAHMHGERIRTEAARHMVQARVHMAQGAEQMRKGARDMRTEAVRLRDPAYRAKQIAENRARGQVVTDAELLDLAKRLPSQADDMKRQASRLAEEARGPT